MTVLDFTDAMAPSDATPELEDVEYPCVVCGREAGPYSGRGPKPKRCPEHKTSKGTAKTPRVAGKDANLAAQATGVLVQLNAMIAMGAAALGLFRTGSAIAESNATFETAAYQALLTDPEFCRMILKGGAKSAKVSLALAYGGMGMVVVPTAMQELKERRDAKREADDNADGY